MKKCPKNSTFLQAADERAADEKITHFLKKQTFFQNYMQSTIKWIYLKVSQCFTLKQRIVNAVGKSISAKTFISQSDKSLRGNLIILSSSCLFKKFCPPSLLFVNHKFKFHIYFISPDLEIPQPTISKCHTETLITWYTEQPAPGTLKEINECQPRWSSTESKIHSILNFSLQ